MEEVELGAVVGGTYEDTELIVLMIITLG